ncbi:MULTISPECIES: SsrA-binding protein SmpB [Kosmotoga]|jgi:SsrA-binding protein|uniref:SsrA-binding protein n=1 Tax=Kosmotoga olearia (strain ATCC BAA-1733 / DSM 21960 / TBF 19.5.1) TaxID=521045 RepID=C5CFR7_KOSOT|nr:MULTISPECIES: SsrA-binding protein SmpB [Kosmotoga]ACR80415.1 SsrA-binding protein [Kosmotoga olearia TBF 19.5.1]MDI3523387.1 SsrA-binding protein [Kosmotoga sp.]MDK2952885.1 SsrA-binding protein [Kosmotoga sp.]OAA19915.1 single-stranded DNA-binding protein [Kosmotoga sp. DU53]
MKIVATNKKARFQYHILETYEAGIQLLGTEVKSLRNGSASISEAFCKFEDGELFLINANISQYSHGTHWNHDPLRKRKLLMHKRELLRIAQKVKERGLTLIPTKIYFNDKGIAKVEIALAKGKRLYDKREDIAKRDLERRLKRRVDY